MHSLDEVQAHRTFSNYILTETARNLYLFHIVRSGSTVPNLLFKSSGDARCAGCNMHRFGEVPAHRTSSNLLELHPHRDSKVYRLLSHEFGVVRLYRTFSTYIFFFTRLIINKQKTKVTNNYIHRNIMQ